MSTLKLTRLSLFTSLALIMSLVENALPPLFWFAPGAKLGLSNLLSLIALFTDGVLGGYIVLIVRILLSAVFGSINSILYSLPAGLVSYTVQVVLVKLLINKLSLVSISVIGGVIHNLVQTLIATLITGVNLYSLVIYTLPAGFIAGLFVGVLAYFLIKKLPDKFFGK